MGFESINSCDECELAFSCSLSICARAGEIGTSWPEDMLE